MIPVLLIAIAAWAIAQVLKLLIATAVYRKFDITYLTTGGGMPSSHSALVCAAAVSCAMSAGRPGVCRGGGAGLYRHV